MKLEIYFFLRSVIKVFPSSYNIINIYDWKNISSNGVLDEDGGFSIQHLKAKVVKIWLNFSNPNSWNFLKPKNS